MSSKNAGPSLIHVPARYSIVEPGVYRAASPTAAQVPYLATLRLKTVVSLTPEHPIKPLVTFIRSSSIHFCHADFKIHLGTTLFRPMTDWKPIRDEIVKTALELILDKRNHPLLVIDPLGIHHNGILFGCLRSMQRWNFAAILAEYRAHSGPSKHRFADEQYIELFDPDIVNLPAQEHLPQWWLDSVAQDESDDDAGWEENEGAPAGHSVIEGMTSALASLLQPAITLNGDGGVG